MVHALNFFGLEELAWSPYTDSLFHCGWKWWTQISSFWDDERQENLILYFVEGQEVDGYCLPSVSASVNIRGTQRAQTAAQSNLITVITVPLVILSRYHCSEVSGIMQAYFSCFQFIKMLLPSIKQYLHPQIYHRTLSETEYTNIVSYLEN
jgi:hypothetical protein